MAEAFWGPDSNWSHVTTTILYDLYKALLQKMQLLHC